MRIPPPSSCLYGEAIILPVGCFLETMPATAAPVREGHLESEEAYFGV